MIFFSHYDDIRLLLVLDILSLNLSNIFPLLFKIKNSTPRFFNIFNQIMILYKSYETNEALILIQEQRFYC